MLEESLKTVRLVHRALIVLAISLILIAIMPSKRARLQRARDELQALDALPLDDFVGTIQEEVPRWDTTHGPRLAEKISAELNLMSNPDATIRSTLNWGPYLYEFRTVEHIYDFFRDNLAACLVVPFEGMLISHIADQLAAQGVSPSECRATKFTFGHSIHLGWPLDEVGYDVNLVHVPSGRELSAGGRIKAKFTQLGTTTPMDWLRSQPRVNVLIGRESGQEVLFPAIRTYWHLVRHRSPKEAIAEISDKLEESPRHISVFGLTLTEDLCWIAGPLGLTAILAYLLGHIRHVAKFAKDSANKTDLRQFPWMPLFPGVMSATITYMSVVALPVAAAGVVIARPSDVPDVVAIFGVAASIMTVVIGIVNAGALASLRREVGRSPKQSTSRLAMLDAGLARSAGTLRKLIVSIHLLARTVIRQSIRARRHPARREK